MRRVWPVLLTLTAACSGSPTAPPPVTTPPQPATYTLSGQLTATNGGQMLNASLDFGVAQTSSQNGNFTIAVPVTAPTLSLTISGSGLVTRRTYVQPGNRTVNLDAISESGFDLTFYRQLVRNTFDAPDRMEPLRRWTQNPRIYIRDSPHAALVASMVPDVIAQWTSGALSAASVERGSDSREGQAGWITVRWTDTPSGPCGQAQVAVSGGWVQFDTNPRCLCGGTIARRGVRHEFGHALGFWHTDGTNDVMRGGDFGDCDAKMTARELAHAAIAYRRAVGNGDPDIDPAGAVNLAPMRVQ